MAPERDARAMDHGEALSTRATATEDEPAWSLVTALAVACIACLLVMLGITLATGVSQEQLEVVRSVDDYRARLVANEPVLRFLMAVDTLFLALYAAFFVVFVGVHRDGRPTAIARLGVGALLGVALLDAIEDHHILALARAAVAGEPPNVSAIVWQHVESQTKFALSYAGLLFVGLGLPRRDRFERLFALSLAIPLPLLGAVIWAAGPALEAPLALVRVVFFLAGFVGAIARRERTRLRCSGVTPR